MATIHNSIGQTKVCHIEVWEDLHAERPGFFRAFWVAPGDSSGCPVVGYCSPGGSHRTIRETVAECRRLGHFEPAYRPLSGRAGALRLVDAGKENA